MFGKACAAAVLALAGLAATPACASEVDYMLPIFPADDYVSACEGKDGWLEPAPPVRYFGTTYGVGTCGITSVLILTNEGLILIDGGMPEAAPLVMENIKRLGFEPEHVRWLLSSHEHLDHTGALAEIRRITGAQMLVLDTAKAAMESGKADPSDPQAAEIPDAPPVTVDRVLHDGEVLELGGLAITVHSTPAHAPGSASWTWQSCMDAVCLPMTYADSVSTPTLGGYRLSDHPDYVAQVRRGLDAVAALPCGILLTPHPSASQMMQRMSNRSLYNPGACRAYAQDASRALDTKLADESKAPS